jgi:hypothetical protein
VNTLEREQIEILNRALMDAWGPGGSEKNTPLALRSYLRTRSELSATYRMFEIANHRVFRTAAGLIVPYDVHGLLVVYELEPNAGRVLLERRFPHGTIFTDESLGRLCGFRGEAIDLDRRIYQLDASDMDAVAVHRLRDLAAVLERINLSGSRHEVVYLMRFLVARLCTSAYRSLAGAKNLQPEIFRVRTELLRFLQGPFAPRLGLPTRVLVRHISSLVSQPRLIERVWQDTIDLCEVHVRGSSIATEIRRSTHHSLGWRTLALARAYLQWLQTGEAEFPGPEHMVPAAADLEAREQPIVIELTERIVTVLQQLLGGAQLATRLKEWRDLYACDLQRCDSGRTLEEEAALLETSESGDFNPWSWQQRLRVISRMVDGKPWQGEAKKAFHEVLAELQDSLSNKQEIDAVGAARTLQYAASAFLRETRSLHQDGLFAELDQLLDLLKSGSHMEVFRHCSRVRHELAALPEHIAFEAQSLSLYQLDCLLEEIGYYALRHLAEGYACEGMNLPQCLTVVRLCAENLVLDGLFSRDLWDLAQLLADPGCTHTDLLDVLEQLQRNYHRLVRRVSEAYEVMAGHLGYGEDEMRAVLGNFFRGMHDLNNLAHFSDAARAYLATLSENQETAPAPRSVPDPWGIVHLSHDEEIVRLVEVQHSPVLRDYYGGKGSGLIYLSWLGIPTRDAFILPTEISRQGLHQGEPERLKGEVLRHLAVLEQDIGRDDGAPVSFGDPAKPLLLAVRGGSVFSMPGMLETIVFVGMTDAVAEALAEDNPWFAWDACRRFLVSYAAAAWRLDLESLDLVDQAKAEHGVALKIDLSGQAMKEVVERTREAIREAGFAKELEALSSDAEFQLHTAIQAVCDSWNGGRARRYRQVKHISERWNTAVIVQQMACGNHANPDGVATDETRISLTGVIPRTHMQPTGFRAFAGDIKFGASGDDLVGGLTEAASFEPVQRLQTLAPMLERRIRHINSRIRRFMGSDAEIEFTVERGVLSVLQTRGAETEHLFEPRTFDDPGEACGRGIGVTGGAFRGVVAFSEEDVHRLRDSGEIQDGEADGILLVLENPVPDEIPLILSVDGLLAAHGGSTAHAAVAVNGIDTKPFSAVLGVPQLKVTRGEAFILDADKQPVRTIRAGDVVSIHGQTGEVFAGSRPILDQDV